VTFRLDHVITLKQWRTVRWYGRKVNIWMLLIMMWRVIYQIFIVTV